jgi:hypothetical protein
MKEHHNVGSLEIVPVVEQFVSACLWEFDMFMFFIAVCNHK